MIRLRILLVRLLALFGRRRLDAELDAELRSHLEMAVEEKVRRGMSPEDARASALRSFGGIERAKELYREQRGMPLLETAVQDLWYGIRMLGRKPGFTLVSVLTLGLGIGANTAIFTVINGVLLKPFPYSDPERLVLLSERDRQMPGLMVSYPDYLDWRAQNRVFEDIAVFNRFITFNLTGGDHPERLAGGLATANLFPILGAAPSPGRGFLPDEDRPGGRRVAVLTHAFWQRRFGGDPAAIGRVITLDAVGYTVVGVLPPQIQLGGVDLWVPLGNFIDEGLLTRGNHNGLLGLARLKPGITFDQARAEMTTIAGRLEKQYPESNSGEDVNVRSLIESALGGIRPALLLLFAAVGLVLLIACANMANLLLARSSARQREIAVRGALGASRGRLVRQFLIESLLFSILGAAAGLLMAAWGTHLLLQAQPASVPRLSMIRIDLTVLGFTAGVAVLTTLIFGLIPALQASRADLCRSFREGPQAGAVPRRRLRSALVVAEVALASLLLIGAGLILRSFLALRSSDPGFRAANVAVARVSLPEAAYATDAKVVAFYSELMVRTSALPGVLSAGATSYLPFSTDGNQTEALIEGMQDPGAGNLPLVDYTRIQGEYFDAMGIGLLRGRRFTEGEGRRRSNVVIVNETMVREFWPDADPVGKRFKANGTGPERPWLEVIAVVRDIRKDGLGIESRPEVYVPEPASPSRDMSVVVRTAAEPGTFASLVREAVWSIDRDLPVSGAASLEEMVAASISRPRFMTTMLSIFAALALALAMIGVYGVLSYLVMQRTNEIGIRMALGARSIDVIRLVAGNALALASAGAAAGTLTALALGRVLSSQLFGVSATDLFTFCAAPAVMILTTLAASSLPARRALKVDPIIALRDG